MAHLSENSKSLQIINRKILDLAELDAASRGYNGACVLLLHQRDMSDYSVPLEMTASIVKTVAKNLEGDSVLAILGEVGDLVEAASSVSEYLRYQVWVAIKRETPLSYDMRSLPHHHIGLLILSKYQPSLRHTKTRIRYSYCPACDKTSKDYGGKKHTYHEIGTLISDVWRDITYSDDNPDPIIERLADLFGLPPYNELRVFDLRAKEFSLVKHVMMPTVKEKKISEKSIGNQLYQGDCLERLKQLPSNSIDFAFADPPYNLQKSYLGYKDDLKVADYFNWCDQWLNEMARVLKPGHTLALLNIPICSIRHYQYLHSILEFQNWIVWDALSFPVRLIMPAHYTILCFTKGTSRELPGLVGKSGTNGHNGHSIESQSLKPMAEGYCLRSSCLEKRQRENINDRGELTDLWWDIHRLKHNTRRVDHPTQLPPQLLYRLISVFTIPEETVLDCFNGSGTTTLTSEQIGRSYIGIEKSATYHKLSLQRHQEIESGLDPFRKATRKLTAKNSPVPRLAKQKYLVPKKTLQLEVKRISKKLSRLPSRDDVIKFSRYPIKLYDSYFVSWGEVCAAARTTGMSEDRIVQPVIRSKINSQLNLTLSTGQKKKVVMHQ